MNYYKKKREKTGLCNICKNKADLTWDHVPPKSCFNEGKIEFTTIFPEMDDTTTLVQNGVKYRTICAECNNGLLGSYDNELKKFVDFITLSITGKIVFQRHISYSGKINHIVRAIIGHFLAAQVKFIDSQINNALREFFLDTDKGKIEDYYLHCQIFPYDKIYTVRDIYYQEVVGDINLPATFMSIMKFFPVAFYLTETTSFGNTQNLSNLCTSDIDEIKSFKIDLANCYNKSGKLYSVAWPLDNKNHFILTNDTEIKSSCKATSNFRKK